MNGERVDLQTFYDAKRSYQDNKVAVFLTGVGAYLMSQVINDIPMDAEVLQATLEKWISFNTVPETDSRLNDASEEKEDTDLNIIFECLVNIRWNITIFDEEKDIGEKEQNEVKTDVRGIIAQLVAQYRGDNMIEENSTTSIHFSNLGKAVSFLTAVRDKIEEYKDHRSEYNLMADIKMALLDVPSDKKLNFNAYVSDILEYAYNQEIIVNGVVKDELLESPYGFEFLGDKALHRSGMTTPLYKLSQPTD